MMRPLTTNVRTAVILAAGMGTRLRSVLRDMPKGFLSLDGRPIVVQSIDKLRESGVERIIIGTGHLSGAYEDLAGIRPCLECVRNDFYAETGSMYTLYNLRHRIDGDFLLLESDLIYEKRALARLLALPRPDVILASGKTDSGDEVFIEVDEKGGLVNLSKDRTALSSVSGELVGISKVSYETFRVLCEATRNSPKIDYEHGFVAISRKRGLFVEKVEDLAWSEIDDEAHLARALRTVYPLIKKRESDEQS